ncbi:beta strand repeat-containing protein [Frigoriglobus tundricola]|uniref:Periplasmic copper-binding protein NosD beta helix domain-containing protein n=1 Tax=Frigoriglobus tundricola TaxID=2774151 RepID=A0A6M5YXD6_9BACT|nr:right-handed parallel beta-helix repeat-containing protein [Frigoriglobus tundricola]QJW98777.1 hypothetical protein FTUN_6372 [Frigoriglobus tundricola]
MAQRNHLGLSVESLEPREVPAVYYVSAAGADTAAGDAAHPWHTLQHAADTVKAGDTVNVLAGNYAGFYLTTSGTASARITFTGQPGADITSDNPTTADGIDLEGASFVTVQGFAVSGTGRAGIRAVADTNVIIQNNDCDQNAVWGIFSGFSKNLQILNNVASRSAQQHGIYVSNSDATGNGNNPTISGNTVWGNHDCGIELNGDLGTSGSGGIITGATVTDNVIYDNGVGGGAGINCDGVQNSVFENNLIYNEHANGISLSLFNGGGGSSNNRVINNTVMVASNGGWALHINNTSTGNTVLNNILDSAAGFPGAFDISTDSLTGLTSDYNLVENKMSTSDGNSANLTLAQWRTATGQDAHSVTSTFNTAALMALFADPATDNYRLIPGSPAINTGTATDAPATDAKGTLRPSMGGVDAGYDQYSTSNITTHFQVSAPATATAGTAFTVTVTAQTGTGTTDTGYRGTVHFTSTDGQAGLPADYTFTAADAGVHTFTVTLKTVGSESVTATDTATGAITGAATATVSTSAGTTFAVSAPSAATAGTAFTVTVTAQTSSGGTNTGYRGTVHFTSTDGQAGLPADYTFTAADAGTHTFTVTLKTAGSKSVTATDTVTSALTSSASTTVSAASASVFQLSEPTTATAGTAFSVTATLKDAYGNVATGYRGTVHFTSTDGQAGLPANYTFTAADAGVHTFTVTLKTAGSESVTATDTVTSALTSSGSTTVSAAAASALQLSEPTTATAGTAFSVTATLKDAYGNAATGYRGTVHFTSTDGQAVLPANYTFTAADAGAHTFTVTLKTAGSESVTATDTVTSALTSSASTTVSAAAASALQLSEPTTATAGSAFSVTATLKDAYGNVATGYRGTVHFTSTDGQAGLPANYTFTAADAGTHTFTVTLKTAGSESVTATDTVTSTITGTAATTVSTSSSSATVLGFNFNGDTGRETSDAATTVATGLSASAITRGTGLRPDTQGLGANSFASGAVGHMYGATLAAAVNLQQYYQFTVQPTSGGTLSLSGINVAAWGQNETPGVGIQVSTDGVNFATVFTGTTNTASANLSQVAAVQGVSGTVTVRVYLYGVGAYESSGLGRASGNSVTVTGSVQSAPTQSVVGFNFAGDTGKETSDAATTVATGLTASAITRGAGLRPDTQGLGANSFASGAVGHMYGATLAAAVNLQQYYQFTVQPTSGGTLSLSGINVAAWGQNETPGVGIQVSTDGVNFATVFTGTTNTASATLSGNPGLQGLSGTVTVRIYLYGVGAYESSGLGRANGNAVELLGSVS